MPGFGVLNFVNLGRQDAFVSVSGADGSLSFIARLASGQATRQYTPVGGVWSVVTAGSYQVTAQDGEQVCLITERGVEMVEQRRALTSDGGTSTDVDFPIQIGGG